MLKTELQEIIHSGENSGVEFKRDDVDARGFAKEAVAFSNFSGGYILLGVEDDRTISGVKRPDVEQWVLNVCRDKIRPEVIPHYELVRDVEPGMDVAAIRIGRGWGVHCVWHNNRREYYLRVGSQSREASPEELERLFRQRGAFRLEVRPVAGSALADLDRRRLRDYMTRTRGQEVPEDGAKDEAWTRLLVNMEVMEELDGRPVCTVAGLLLFGKRPNRFLPQSGIDATAYPGTDKDYAARERTTLRGAMMPLYGTEGLVENGLVEQAMAFVTRNIHVETTLENHTRRKDRWDYPLEAVREAIVNALTHRDYLLSGTTIELSIYENRLEIVSPGQLPNGVTPERMKTGCRAARNQLLKDVMRDYGYLEHIGMGVPRKIVKGMMEHNGTEPDLVEEHERFTVRLWK